MSTSTLEAPVASATAAPVTAAAPDLATPIGGAMGGVNEFLTFRLGQEEYGIDILRVQEIRSFEMPTRIANAPSFILGVTNLRGVIVPIIDMRLRFHLDNPVNNDTTVTIVLALGRTTVGMVVDGVSDVTTLTHEQMHPAPAFSAVVDSDHIHAIGTIDQRMLILIDIVKLMASPGMGLQD
ncbi:MAG: chemotaxis protein CheW [Rubrivivax sp.]|nr:chemotaxis protein CheW [Rubrivivax sp.]